MDLYQFAEMEFPICMTGFRQHVTAAGTTNDQLQHGLRVVGTADDQLGHRLTAVFACLRTVQVALDAKRIP
ncbi:hypothetical protein QVD17_34880 [Tagetes erecta]|uniref:Uncharacterized protein n=1 Tax=Tagetes erecta TaxID=13708 RepID=A0AAD8JZX0_TARER|nr:hypothetical protein QVD17_34880 [Tagetes erecta]